jgi:hypothetical protein
MDRESFEERIEVSFKHYDICMEFAKEETRSVLMTQLQDLMIGVCHVARDIPSDAEWKEDFLEKWTGQYSKRLLEYLLLHNSRSSKK